MEDYSLPQGSYFLGFDSSTQSLKATVLDANLKIISQEIVNFDSELSHYKTKDGVYRDPCVNGRIVSPTIMWVEAFDLILERLENSGLEFGKIAAISGSGQQHGSVYWKNGSSRILSSLDPKTILSTINISIILKFMRKIWVLKQLFFLAFSWLRFSSFPQKWRQGNWMRLPFTSTQVQLIRKLRIQIVLLGAAINVLRIIINTAQMAARTWEKVWRDAVEGMGVEPQAEPHN